MNKYNLIYIIFIFNFIICSGWIFNYQLHNQNTYHSPCVSPFGNGYCVPNRQCCRDWDSYSQNEFEKGDCRDQDLCCTYGTLCQGQIKYLKIRVKYNSYPIGCQRGYKEENGTCIDINECDHFGFCSGHKCNNTIGSYECECFDSFEMIGALKSCQHINHSQISDLLFTESSKINLMPFNGTEVKTENIQMLYSGTAYPKSIDYSFNGNYMAWTDTSTKMINIAPVNYKNPSSVINMITLRNVNRPFILSIDWTHDLIYWTDLEDRTINVVNIHKPYDYYTVINSTNKMLHDLKVNVVDSCLVWTYIGPNPRIMRSFQDGTNQSILYSSSKQPFYITIDIHLKRYFFVDSVKNQLCSIDFQGHDERTIAIHWPGVLSLIINSPVIYGDDIFLLTDSTLRSYNKFGFDNLQHNYEVKVKSPTIFNFTRILDFKIMDPSLQPSIENKCQKSRCSHICLLSHNTNVFQCLCPRNHVLVNNSICAEFGVNAINSEKTIEVLINHAISNELKNAFTKSNVKQEVGYATNITHVIGEGKKGGEEVILILILLILLVIALILATGFKFDFSKIKTPKCMSQSHPLYRRSNEDSIEELESKTEL